MENKSYMTPEELAEYCRASGQPMPDLTERRRCPVAKIALDLGESYGAARITVECSPDFRQHWRKWLRDRQVSLGGDLKE